MLGTEPVTLGRKSWTDAGSERAVVSNSLIIIARLNDVEPQAWLANILSSGRQPPPAPGGTIANPPQSEPWGLAALQDRDRRASAGNACRENETPPQVEIPLSVTSGPER